MSSRHNLIFDRSIGIRTMMHLRASAAKLRGGGPNLRFGLEAGSDTGHRHLGSFVRTTTVAVVRPPNPLVQTAHPTGRKARPCRYLARGRKTPERDQQLACQRHDHGFALAGRILSSGSIPLCQSATLQEHQEAPGQLDHAATHPRVACLGKTFFPLPAPAFVQ